MEIRPGDIVKIISGALFGFHGTVAKVKENGVDAFVSIFGTKRTVFLTFEQIRLI